MVADATTDLIRDLEDPTKFRKTDHVSVFKPHVRDLPEMTLGDGRVIPARRVVVDLDTLREIAERTNRRYAADGHLVVLTLGHRRMTPGVDERTQPLKVGYAKGYRAAVVDRPGGPVLRLLHTEYVDRKHEAEAANYPFRSPEYDPDDKVFGGVALLKREPHLDLGTVHYDAGSGRVLYAMEGEMTPTANPGAEVDDFQAGADDVQYADFCGAMKKYAKHKGFMRKYMADVGATNGALPAPPAGGGPAGGPGATPPPMAYERTIAEVTAQLAQSQQREAATARALVTANCSALLAPLKDRVSFLYERELTYLVDQCPTDEARFNHVKYMAAHYEKKATAPGGLLPTLPGQAPLPGGAGQSYTTDPTVEPPHHQRTMAYVRSHPGVSYERAEQVVLSGTAG